MHLVRETVGCEYILVGLGRVKSLKRFDNDDIKIGDKVRLIVEPFREEEVTDGGWQDSVRALGYEGTWGEIGYHYELEYAYPYCK